MYFKRLEIFGFKSFADKTILNFEPGITAVVGPNGCGKSNIFDAIRWVLGEQSIKELRGSSMEDVIFSGTDKKPGLGFAEVSLSFSNESKILPIEYNEVTVTRRLFRSGESEYLLNKTVVRLKDIVELFMGTGIGAEAYSLVQQGKVDLVVSARPEDRRVILDEASGITKYKMKKKEALNKLKDTENNLLRLNDIVLEVKRQIGSIERQAHKARRYKEEFEKLKDFEIKLARHEIRSFELKKKEAERLLENLKNKEKNLNEQLEELKAVVVYENDHLSDLDQKINELGGDQMKLESAMEINSRQIQFNEERLENLFLNEARLDQQKAQILERSRQQQEKMEELKQSVESLNADWENHLNTLQEKKEDLKRISQSIDLDKETIRQGEEKILSVNSQQVRFKNGLTEIMKESQGCLAQKRRLELENVKVCGEKDEVDQKYSMIGSEIHSVLEKIEGLRKNQESQKHHFHQLKEQLAHLKEEFYEAEKKKLFLISQKAFIEELSVQYQDIPDPSIEGRLLATTAPPEKHSGIIGKVKEVLPFDPQKYLPQAPFSPSYEIVCETKFIELDPQEITNKITELDGKISSLNGQKLNLEQTLQQQEHTLETLSEAIHREERRLSILEAQKKDILENSSKLLGELEVMTAELKEVQDSLLTLKRKEEDLIQQLNASNQQLLFIQDHIKERQENIAASAKNREQTTVIAAQLEVEIASTKDKVQTQQENFIMFTESWDASLEEIKRLDDEKAQHVLKKEKIQQEIVEIKNQMDFLHQKKESLKGTLAEYEKQKNDVFQQLNSIRGSIIAFEKELEDIKSGIHAEEMRNQQMLFQTRGIKDKLFQVYRVDPGTLDTLDTVETTGVDQNSLAPALAGELNIDELSTEIERLKKRCESYGAVNLVAIEEFEELRNRFEFLTKQQSDLLTARESLHQTISKINRTTREMFMETFTKVSEEFRIYFRMLFGGGEAQLVLLDPENVLESGIEIVARPPGKKLQNIDLLSGGEKTLTAIALIFGVFKVRPSPFCVLDEIDAALDESNVGRFGYLLKDFAKISQFIVITHNKKTISQADVMYGITMQETGVSKIVSVKFSDEKEEKNATQSEVAVEVG